MSAFPLKTSAYSEYMFNLNIRDRIEYAAAIEQISNKIFMEREIASKSQHLDEQKRVHKISKAAIDVLV